MTRTIALTAAIAILGSAALAESEHSLNGTIVRLQETQTAGAVADVQFENRAVNDDGDNGAFALDWNAVGVQITFTWNANATGDDEILIETDAAHVAVPRRLTVHEGETGTAQIYPLDKVGF
jgi:hypothetical protein